MRTKYGTPIFRKSKLSIFPSTGLNLHTLFVAKLDNPHASFNFSHSHASIFQISVAIVCLGYIYIYIYMYIGLGICHVANLELYCTGSLKNTFRQFKNKKKGDTIHFVFARKNYERVNLHKP